jgi:hypothetical protein
MTKLYFLHWFQFRITSILKIIFELSFSFVDNIVLISDLNKLQDFAHDFKCTFEN